MNASGTIYGRYGSRDAKGPDTRNSLEGLRYAMQAALAAHRRDPTVKPAQPPQPPLRIEKLLTTKKYKGCLHCHQVKEILRQEQINAGTWQRDSIFSYPLPENVGLTLNKNRGNHVQTVKLDSPAAMVGLKPGDMLQTLNSLPVHSFADAQYALHRAPAQGPIPLTWTRQGQTFTGQLSVAAGWRLSNITWRPSLLNLLPALTLYGSDLTGPEKKTLGLDPKRLAFRQEKPVHSQARDMGVQENDIIIGLDNQVLEMTMDAFLGHVRQNYLIGERITLNLIRNGKKIDLLVTLR